MPEQTIAEALNAAHHQLMKADDSVICFGEDFAENGGVFGVSEGLLKSFGPDRVFDTPISETAFVGMAVGAAMTGLKPIVELMFCDFAGVCFDQILNQAAKARFLSNGQLKMPLVIRTTMGAGDGSGAMHSQSLHGLFASIPGLVVVVPSSPADAAGLLKSAVMSDDPVIFMEHKKLYGVTGPIDPALPPVPIGKARVLKVGADITIVAASAMAHAALEAAELLENKGVAASVIDPRTIKPFDIETVEESLNETGRLLVVDEGAAFGGFADAVVAEIGGRAFGALKTAPKKLTPSDTPVPYAVEAEQAWLPNSQDIVDAATRMMEV